MLRLLIGLSLFLLLLSGGVFAVVCSQTGAFADFSGLVKGAAKTSRFTPSTDFSHSQPFAEAVVTPASNDADTLFKQAIPDAILRERAATGLDASQLPRGQQAIAALPSPPPYAHALSSGDTRRTLTIPRSTPSQTETTTFPTLAQNANSEGQSFSVAEMSGQNITPPSNALAVRGCGKAGSNNCGLLASPNGTGVEISSPPATNCPSPLKDKNDDLYLAVNPPPKRGKELDIGVIYEYRKVQEAPSYATGIPVRCSTEAMVSQMVTYSNFKTPLPRIAMGKKPSEDEVLNPTRQDGFRFTLTPYWERTDFGAAYKEYSSKWDEMGLLGGVQYYYDKFSLDFSMPMEYNSFSGRVSRYGFTRLANIITPKFDILSEERGNALDAYVGLNGFYSWVMGDTAMVPSEFQYGMGAFAGLRKDLKYIIPAFFVDWENTFKEPGGYTVKDSGMTQQMNIGSDGLAAWPIDSKQNLVNINAAVGIPLGTKFMVTPGYYYHTALTSTRSEYTNWSEYRVDFLLALNPATVIDFHIGAEGDPLKTWNMGGGLGMKIKF